MVLSSAPPAVATAASTAGSRCMRLHGVMDPTRRRLSREGEVEANWSLDLCFLERQTPNNIGPPSSLSPVTS